MQDLITYFDNTRYENLNSLVDKGEVKPDVESAKLAKISAFARLKSKTDAIKSELAKNTEATEVSQPVEQPQTEVAEQQPVAPQIETPAVEYPSSDILQAKLDNHLATVYNTLGNSSAPSLGRKLRVAPQVKNSTQYVKDTLGIEYVAPIVEQPALEPEIEENSQVGEMDVTNNIENEMNIEANAQEPVEMSDEHQTFDFSALPGVDANVSFDTPEYSNDNNTYSDEGNLYEENIHTEQDDRLNDYLNRENSLDNMNMDYTPNFDELEEIRKLKREIEEARESLIQVKQNVGDLQQKDNAISQQLEAYKRSLMEEKDALNAELIDQTREWNDLTQLVRQKEELIDENESYGMGRAA